MKRFVRYFLVILCVYAFGAQAQDWQTPFEKSDSTETTTYAAGIAYYQKLVKAYPTLHMDTIGTTDSGEPLRLILFNTQKVFDPAAIRKGNQVVFLVNNAIHPGEPDGVDACMMWLRELASGRLKPQGIDKVILAIIPFYNIGGALNRNCCTRANQDGPVSYGFRGNAKNLDLNRDFMKMDSRNAFAFAKLFHSIDPDVLVDTHVSDGADYQHIITLLSTQHNKLGGPLGPYLENTFEPAIYKNMAAKGYTLVPYVNVFGQTPDEGWQQFDDEPRYASGYTTLFQTLGFTTETHMLKPFKERVIATYTFLNTVLQTVIEEKDNIQQTRAKAKAAILEQKDFPLSWKVDPDHYKMITFKGYEASHPESPLTHLPRLFYDESKPFEKLVPFYNQFDPTNSVEKPRAYVIPQAYWRVIARLKANNVTLHAVQSDTSLMVSVYHIDSTHTIQQPFEGHYMHYGTAAHKTQEKVQLRKGDYIVPVQQAGIRYIIEALEPEATDSFFNWNFFDPILQQKEYFSPYVFIDKGPEILDANPELKKEFLKKQETDSVFAHSERAQLNFLYVHSKYHEKAYMRYPIYRID